MAGNYLCPHYPECVENAIEIQNTEDCIDINIGDIDSNGQIDIIDVVMLVSFILGDEDPNDSEFLLADFNFDGFLNILDVIDMVSAILQN